MQRSLDCTLVRKPASVTNITSLRPCAAAAAPAGPASTRPFDTYKRLDAQPHNRAIMALFRQKMVAALGRGSDRRGYDAIVELTHRLNSEFPSARETQAATLAILQSLFPPWLPGAFKALFSRSMPGLSCQMNAWVTMLTCQWLMGPCQVNDVEIDGGGVGKGHGVLVERCRYLEETGCASVCINSCKIPTQRFFAVDMGLPLTMTPDYKDFSCQFSFGRTPVPEEQDEALATPCFTQCPSRRPHQGPRCPGIVPAAQMP